MPWNRPYRIVRSSRAFWVLVLALLACRAEAAQPSGPVHHETADVVRVVDGDTLEVFLDGEPRIIRLIGVDTPETVHPRRPVECFGAEASAFMTRLAAGKQVRLETDQQTGNRDRYRRLLRYVYLPDGRILNAEIIAQGYGFAYTRYPFTRMEDFRSLERDARAAGRGLWAEGVCGADRS